MFQLNIASSSLLLIIGEFIKNLNSNTLNTLLTGETILIGTLDLLGKNMVAIAFYSITGLHDGLCR
ncbi:hypothetical protein EFR95_07035 [Lactobacillus amylovorus]|nr:hypothetical protein [Lactobacillus amylovorus]